MNQQVMTALIELLKQGGHYALWGIFLWFGMQILKVAVIGGTVFLSIRSIVGALRSYLEFRLQVRKEQITLISQETSASLTATVQDFATQAKETFETILEKLKETSDSKKESTKI